MDSLLERPSEMDKTQDEELACVGRLHVGETASRDATRERCDWLHLRSTDRRTDTVWCPCVARPTERGESENVTKRCEIHERTQTYRGTATEETWTLQQWRHGILPHTMRLPEIVKIFLEWSRKAGASCAEWRGTVCGHPCASDYREHRGGCAEHITGERAEPNAGNPRASDHREHLESCAEDTAEARKQSKSRRSFVRCVASRENQGQCCLGRSRWCVNIERGQQHVSA